MMETCVIIDGRRICLDIETANGKDFEIKIGDRKFRTHLVKNSHNTITVDVNGRNHVVDVNGDEQAESIGVSLGPRKLDVKTAFLNDLRGLKREVRKTETLKKVTDSFECADLNGAVVAAMPGKVVSVAAAVGQDIRENEVICILEAMKMQNEVIAPKNGTIREVCCCPGDLVEKGDVLVRIN